MTREKDVRGKDERGLPLDRREFLALTGATAAALLIEGLPLAEAGPEKRKPNVIVFFTDDQGYGDSGCYGCRDIPTPNIDSIARNGVKFTDGYVSAPICGPSRAGLLTGRYQQRFGHEFNFSPRTWYGTGVIDANRGLPLEEITIADALKAAGYATGVISKWHLGMAPKYHPLRRGFDEFYGTLDTVGPKVNYQPNYQNNGVMRGTEPVDYVIPFLTEEWTKEAVSFIERHRDKPIFLYLPYDAPHGPLEATQKYLDRFRHISDETRRSYAGMMSAVDDSVGEILGKLRELGLEQDTLVFFLSDNGGTFSGPGKVFPGGASNGPLRDYKSTFFEGGIRVPFLFQWPRRVKGGQVYRQPVISLDIFATAVAAAGGKMPKDRVMDGMNLIPYLTGLKDGPPHEFLFWREMEMFRSFHKGYAVRSGRWKLVKSREGGFENVGDQPVRLFDLTEDIGEKNDVATEHPKVVQHLTKALAKWESELSMPRWPRYYFERPQ
ncbi:MAG: sulfatase-like hydrolase/transferase [Armatimonadetes bacterium]|nr:sulfatase-like hydrolase/transferase [Armatimonadota bacterium]